MTLSTNLVILDPIEPLRVFSYALGLVCEGLDLRTDPIYYVRPCGDEIWPNPYWSTLVGQGLPAWLMVHFALDGPLRLTDDFEPGPFNDHCLRIRWDTERFPDDRETALHAHYVGAVGRWLNELDLDWWWTDDNAHTDGWHHGLAVPA